MQMKRILLFMVALFATMSMYANVDTVFVKPSEQVTLELKVDTVKYPMLKGFEDSVAWYVEDKEFTPIELSNSKYFEAKLDSSANVYYKFKYLVTKANDSYIKDTVNYIHVYDIPKIDSISPLDVNVYEGDLVSFDIKVKNPLDVTQVYLLANKDTLLKSSDLTFKYVPDSTINYTLVLANPYTSIDTSSVINVTPKVRLINLEYQLISEGESITKTTSENSVNIMLFNHDALKLIVNTNIDSAKFMWNKDGSFMPKGIEINNDTLSIKEYDKNTMDGIYNCLVSDGRTEFIVTYNVSSDWATNNEELDYPEVLITIVDNNVTVENAMNKHLLITDITGKVLVNKVVKYSYEELYLPSGIYIFKVNNETFKLKVN